MARSGPSSASAPGRVAGYFSLGIAGHGVVETEDDAVLVREAARQMPPDFHRVLCPLTRRVAYTVSFLASGFRNIKVMNLMALGPYEEPEGVWMPSVLY